MSESGCRAVADRALEQNWNTFWKVSTLICATAATFNQGMGPLSLAPMFPQLMEAFDSDLASVVQFTGVCILVLGFSNFIWLVGPSTCVNSGCCVVLM